MKFRYFTFKKRKRLFFYPDKRGNTINPNSNIRFNIRISRTEFLESNIRFSEYEYPSVENTDRGETKVLRQFVASKLIHESAAVVVGVFALRAVGEKEKEEGGLLFASLQTPFSFLPSSSSFHVVEMQIKVAEEEEKRKRGDEGHANQRRSWNQRRKKSLRRTVITAH